MLVAASFSLIPIGALLIVVGPCGERDVYTGDDGRLYFS